MIGQVYIESPLLTQQNQQELVRWARELQTMTIIKTQEMSVQQSTVLAMMRASNPSISTKEQPLLYDVDEDSLLLTNDLYTLTDARRFAVGCLLETKEEDGMESNLFYVRSVSQAAEIFALNDAQRKLRLQFDRCIQKKMRELRKTESKENLKTLVFRFVECLCKQDMQQIVQSFRQFKTIYAWQTQQLQLLKSKVLVGWRILTLQHSAALHQAEILSHTLTTKSRANLLAKVFFGWKQMLS